MCRRCDSRTSRPREGQASTGGPCPLRLLIATAQEVGAALYSLLLHTYILIRIATVSMNPMQASTGQIAVVTAPEATYEMPLLLYCLSVCYYFVMGSEVCMKNNAASLTDYRWDSD